MRRWLGLALFVLAAMAVGRVITDTLPTDRLAAAPFVREGAVGDAVDLGYAEVTVTGIRSADVLTGSENGVFPGSGTWLVVDSVVMSTRKAEIMSGIELHAPDGRIFFPSARPTCSRSIDPLVGVPWHTMFCFEVPEDALEGLVFRFTRGSYNVQGDMQRRDAVADIDLGIDAERARSLWDAEDVHTPHFGSPDPYDTSVFEEDS